MKITNLKTDRVGGNKGHSLEQTIDHLDSLCTWYEKNAKARDSLVSWKRLEFEMLDQPGNWSYMKYDSFAVLFCLAYATQVKGRREKHSSAFKPNFCILIKKHTLLAGNGHFPFLVSSCFPMKAIAVPHRIMFSLVPCVQYFLREKRKGKQFSDILAALFKWHYWN